MFAFVTSWWLIFVLFLVLSVCAFFKLARVVGEKAVSNAKVKKEPKKIAKSVTISSVSDVLFLH